LELGVRIRRLSRYRNVGAIKRAAQRDGTPDAPARASYEDGLAFQRSHPEKITRL
jgi:hypothetical protein